MTQNRHDPNGPAFFDAPVHASQKRAWMLLQPHVNPASLLHSDWTGPRWHHDVDEACWLFTGGRGRATPWTVVIDVRIIDGVPWMHVSVSGAHQRVPNHDMLTKIRRVFMPADRVVGMVWPPADEVVEQRGVRHLWCRLEGPRLTPDFRRFGGA